ncbi:ribokinase [Nesterenkonia jeotgali]|uniref:Ribokinase n=1 Tax=Nesterenkonia jeotgali TaxID=317018 RepID=A0A839FX03_9MICC|nr:ribokinase [Nesterenkonia jeotgali]MBA8921287.1 ribokinase [Nesterenkonia jeotgali]
MTLLIMGSVNRDITVRVSEFPTPGQTLLASTSETATGGKSANQAVAAALVGAQSHLIARCGSDAAGAEAVRSLREAGVHVDAVTPGRGAQGMAFISVRADGENTIVVVPGANTELQAEDCPAELLADAEWMLLSLEVPLETVHEAAARAQASGTRVALNASPLSGEPVDLRHVDLVIVNEGEAAELLEVTGTTGDTGAPNRPPRSAAADPAQALGVQTLIVTRGAEGASIHTAGQDPVHVPSVPVQAVDTSGAGDAFAGALLGRLTCGDSLEDAAGIAARFAASATTGVGAQSSYPRNFSLG